MRIVSRHAIFRVIIMASNAILTVVCVCVCLTFYTKYYILQSLFDDDEDDDYVWGNQCSAIYCDMLLFLTFWTASNNTKNAIWQETGKSRIEREKSAEK